MQRKDFPSSGMNLQTSFIFETIPYSCSGMTSAQAIRRAMDIVRAVTRFQGNGGTLSRIAKATGLSTSTAHRILRALTDENLLTFDQTTRYYNLGRLAAELGIATRSKVDDQPNWRATIEQIARQTSLTTYLIVRSDCEAVCLLCVQGANHIRAVPMEVGQRIPLGVEPGSLAILAAMDDEEIRRVLASNASRLHPLVHDGPQLHAIFDRVRQARLDGYAVSDEIVTTGLCGVAVPILPRNGLLQFAIGVSTVADSLNSSEARMIAAQIRAGIRKRFSQD